MVQWCRDACRVAGTRQPSRERRTGGRLGRKGWGLWKEVSRVGPSHGEARHGFLLTLGDRDSTGSLAGFQKGPIQGGPGEGSLQVKQPPAGAGASQRRCRPLTAVSLWTCRAGPGPAHPQRAAARQTHRLRGFPGELTAPVPDPLRSAACRHPETQNSYSQLPGWITHSAFLTERAVVKHI